MLSPIVKKALYFASQKHDGQYRKGGHVPYITHPVQVAFGVGSYTNDEGIIAAALLHDVLEDCVDVSINLLQKEFGDRITRMVSEVSLNKGKKHKTWKEKKETYLKKIKEESKDALIIIAVDKMDNMQAYFEGLKDKGYEMSKYFGGTPDEYRWYYKTIGDILMVKLRENHIVKDYLTILNLYTKQGL